MRAFVEHLVRTCNMVGSRAAIAAGYSEKTARKRASTLLARPDVQAAVQQLLEEKVMSASEVEARLGDHARADIDEFLDDEGFFDIELARAAGVTHLIREWESNEIYDKDGNHIRTRTKVKLHDAQAALTTLAKRHGMLRDQTTNLNLDMNDLTDEQLQRIAEGEDPMNVLRDREPSPDTG